MSSTIPYIKPGAAQKYPAEDWDSFPEAEWPNVFVYPDFQSWQKTTKQSAVRNLICLLLYELGFSTENIAKHLDLSESRALQIARITRLKVFGKDYKRKEIYIKSNVESFAKHPKDAQVLQHMLKKKAVYPAEKRAAILWSIDRMSSGGADLNLVHSTIGLLKNTGNHSLWSTQE
jgi:hypothetical protein